MRNSNILIIIKQTQNQNLFKETKNYAISLPFHEKYECHCLLDYFAIEATDNWQLSTSVVVETFPDTSLHALCAGVC